MFYLDGHYIVEENFLYNIKARRKLLTNWPLVDRRKIKSLRLWNKGEVKIEINNEFILVPTIKWFYYLKYHSFNPGTLITSRTIGFPGTHFEVMERTGERILHKKEYNNAL